MIEQTIISNLVTNEQFMQQAIPNLREDYFHDHIEKTVFKLVSEHIKKYDKSPTKQSLQIDLSNLDTLSEDQFKDCKAFINNMPDNKEDAQYLVDKSQVFTLDKSCTNGLMKCIKVLESNKPNDAIPGIMETSLKNGRWDTSIGLDIIEDWKTVYEFLHNKEEKISFDIDCFNQVTDGGVSRKTLNVIMAGTNVGKSMALCHFAASNLSAGRNVLYITLEMAAERISERIYANLWDVSIKQVGDLLKQDFERKNEKVRQRTEGKLIVKEYATASAHAGHFEATLKELKTQRNFVPDIIYVDYLNICQSKEAKMSYGANTYIIVKAIAEELRAMAQRSNAPVFTATQTNRSGYTSSDPGLEDTSESFGLPATADFFVAMTRSDDLDALNQISFRVLKNRYGEGGRRFVVGGDFDKMRLYNVEQSAQNDIVDNGKGKFDYSNDGFEEYWEEQKGKSQGDIATNFFNKPNPVDGGQKMVVK